MKKESVDENHIYSDIGPSLTVGKMDKKSGHYEKPAFTRTTEQDKATMTQIQKHSATPKRLWVTVLILSITVLLLVGAIVVMSVMMIQSSDTKRDNASNGRVMSSIPSTLPTPEGMFTTEIQPTATTQQDHACFGDNPCQNQGVCKPSGPDGYLCDCRGLWWGQNCTVCGGQPKIVTAQVVRETYTRTISVPIITENCTPGKEAPQYTVLMRRQDGSVDFFKNWIRYKDGFGDLENEFWIGNENMHYLTNNGTRYRLRVDLRTFSGEHGYAEYDGFTVGPDSTKYRLTLGSFLGGNAGNSLGRHSGRSFTTFDVSGHSDSATCPTTYQGAWWYDECFWAQLTGPYSSVADVPFAMGVIWRDYKGYQKSMKFAEMKLYQI